MINGKYPRYVTVYDTILKDIQSEKYKPGDKLPSENELAIDFRVSRNTVRQALLLLNEDGYVKNYQGKGTIVINTRSENKESMDKLNNPLISLSLTEIDKVETMIEIRKISPKNQKIFGLDASQLLILIEMVYISQNKKIGCALVFVPYELLAKRRVLLDDMEEVTNFYNKLIQTEGFYTESELKITFAREPVTKLLDITSSQLVMLDEVFYNREGKVVMTQKLFFLPDSYKFSIVRKN